MSMKKVPSWVLRMHSSQLLAISSQLLVQLYYNSGLYLASSLLCDFSIYAVVGVSQTAFSYQLLVQVLYNSGLYLASQLLGDFSIIPSYHSISGNILTKLIPSLLAISRAISSSLTLFDPKVPHFILITSRLNTELVDSSILTPSRSPWKPFELSSSTILCSIFVKQQF